MQESTDILDTAEAPETQVVDLPGKLLLAAREEQHMSRDEVAHHLHLDVKLITALEEDDYEKLPSPSYICGYLRSYARLMKLPEQEIVDRYSHGQEISSALLPENINISPGRKSTKKIPLMPAVVIAIVLLVLFVAFWGIDMFNVSRSQNTPSASGTQESITEETGELIPLVVEQEPAVEQTTEMNHVDEPAEITEFKKDNQVQVQEQNTEVQVKQKPDSKPGPSLQLIYTGSSWTEVVDGDGRKVIYRLVTSGSKLVADGRPPYRILLGNASVVKVIFKGREFDHSSYQRGDIAYFRLGNTQ